MGCKASTLSLGALVIFYLWTFSLHISSVRRRWVLKLNANLNTLQAKLIGYK